MRLLSAFCLSAALVMISAQALAGSVQVGPIMVQMVDRERASTVTLRNSGAESVTMQVRTMDWTQATGDDALTQSQSLIASPPTFTLQPGESQTVRLVVEGLAANVSERSWRLIVDELPRESANAQPSVVTPVRLYIPVFLSPSNAARPNLRWTARRTGDAVTVSAQNSGDGFERVSALNFSANGASLGDATQIGYVLAGSTRTWTVSAPAGARSVTAAGTGVLGEISTEVPIE